jgi:D-alanyl-D-alanine-carboxypeptidase/D-alanyl-D-alanine-endopeptidase
VRQPFEYAVWLFVGEPMATLRTPHRRAAVPLAAALVCSLAVSSADAGGFADRVQQIADGIAAIPECQGAAIAIATVGKAGSVEVFAGSVSYGSGPMVPADARTIFEIGSITKTFTAELFAEAVKAGLVKPDDPVASYLPAGANVPSFQSGGQTYPIRLIDLATHTSGLPSVPDGVRYPYATSAMFADLAKITLTRRPGTGWEYSNLGFALLANAMEKVFKEPIAALLVEHVSQPLGMTSTRMVGDATDGAKIPVGYGPQARPAAVNNATWPAFDGAGALRSTLDDMQRYLAFAMGAGGPPDADALRRLLFDWHTYPSADGTLPMQQGLAWQRWVPWNNGIDVVWKDGSVPAFSSYIGFSARLSQGAVVLANRNGCNTQRGAFCVLRAIGEADGIAFGNVPNCDF